MPDTMPRIPEAALRPVRSALSELHHVFDEMRRARDTLDDPRGPVGGCGRYEAEVVDDHAGVVTRALADLAKFRAAAARNGVDADAVFADLGGVPDLTPSPAAAAYLAGASDHRTVSIAAR